MFWFYRARQRRKGGFLGFLWFLTVSYGDDTTSREMKQSKQRDTYDRRREEKKKGKRRREGEVIVHSHLPLRLPVSSLSLPRISLPLSLVDANSPVNEILRGLLEGRKKTRKSTRKMPRKMQDGHLLNTPQRQDRLKDEG